MGELPLGKYDKVNGNILMLVSKIGIATYLVDTIEMIYVLVSEICSIPIWPTIKEWFMYWYQR